jgi:transcriptional regulator with XRE-family HTH domain
MKNEKSTPFGERLIWARKRLKLTQKVAAGKVGMSQGTLAELERDGQGSSYTPALAALYEVNSVWLATGKGDRFKAPEPLTRTATPTPGLDVTTLTPTPIEYAQFVQLFGEAQPETRKVVLTLFRKAAEQRARNGVIGNNESQGTGGESGA